MRGCGCPYHGASGWPHPLDAGWPYLARHQAVGHHYHRPRSGPGPVPRPAFKAGGAVRSRLEGSTPSPLRAGGTLAVVSATPLPGVDLLLERERELGCIDAAIAAARAGTGRSVVVEGPAGIGKSAVLAAARGGRGGRGDALPARAWRRARARLRLRRRAPALRAAARARRAPPSAPTCCRARAAGGRACSGSRAHRRRARRRPRRPTRRSPSCTASTGCARTWPRRQPLVLTVDDAHWADALLAALPGLPDAAPGGAAVALRRRHAARGRGRGGAPAGDPHRRSARRRRASRAAERRRGGPARRGAARRPRPTSLRRRVPPRHGRRRRSSCASWSRR